jgi:hypothetical protein
MKKIITTIAIVLTLQINAQIINTIIGNGTSGFSGDNGQAILAELHWPQSIAFDIIGNIYIADVSNQRIRTIDFAGANKGVIRTFAGTGTAGYSGDGGSPTLAKLSNPKAIAFNRQGNMYIADEVNNRIRMINTLGYISTVAGNGVQGFSGDGMLATSAKLYRPSGVAVDTLGGIYISDSQNNRIRKINSMGIISTYAGNGTTGYSGDGGNAVAAELNSPQGIVVDATGNLFIADALNNVIRMVNTSGIISTYAGNGTGGVSGDGGAATSANLDIAAGLAIDGQGNLYIPGLTVVRMVNTSGIITTIAGNGTYGFNGDGGQALAAELKGAIAVSLDASGNIYIADNDDARIRVISKGATLSVNSPTICAGVTTTLTASGANTYSWSTNATTASISPSPTVTTTYSVAGTNTLTIFNVSCTSIGTATTSVTVNSLPTVNAASNTTSLCSGNTATLTASGANTYTWSTNQTDTNITISPTIPTIYSVTGTDSNGCINSDTITQVVTNCNTTDISTIEVSNNHITIYPNPSNGNFIIEINSSEKQTLRIFDVTGKLVLIQSINDNATIVGGHLTAGV